jgi:ribose transport system substrate-binding protein
MRVQYLFPTLENPFWQAIVAGMRARAASESVSLEFSSAEDDEGRQAQQLSALHADPPDVVLASPCGMSQTRPEIARLMAAGIPVVAVDQNLGDDVTASVISGNTAGGVALGAYLAKHVDGPIRMLHLEAQADLQSVMIRRRSFLSRCQREHEHEIVKRRAGGSRRRARETVETCIADGFGFDVVFAENDVMALGAVDALEVEPPSPWPVILGYDAIDEALRAIRRGQMAATVMQRPREMGEAAIETAVAIHRNAEIDRVRTVLTDLITIDNVDEHHRS